MMGEVLAFLDGKTVDLKVRIRAMMQSASEREDYERARDLRDALKWLDQVEAPTTVDVIGTGDADVIGYARDGDDAAGVIFRVRDGRVVGREHRFLENVETETDQDVLSTFLVRWYIPLEGKAKRIILPFAPSELTAVSEILADHRLFVPQRARIAAAVLSRLAEQNAGEHLLESLRIESFETEERAEDPVYALGRELGLTVVPRTFICVDISTNPWRDTVGSLVTFEAGRPRKAEYRKFKIKGIAQQDDYAAIHEVITRYFRRRLDEGKPLPDLVVIDGGKGQLSAAQDALIAVGLGELPLASLAKREEEIYLPGRASVAPCIAPQSCIAAAAAGTGRSTPLRRDVQPQATDGPYSHLGTARHSRCGPDTQECTPAGIRITRGRALRLRGRARRTAGILRSTGAEDPRLSQGELNGLAPRMFRLRQQHPSTRRASPPVVSLVRSRPVAGAAIGCAIHTVLERAEVKGAVTGDVAVPHVHAAPDG